MQVFPYLFAVFALGLMYPMGKWMQLPLPGTMRDLVHNGDLEQLGHAWEKGLEYVRCCESADMRVYICIYMRVCVIKDGGEGQGKGKKGEGPRRGGKGGEKGDAAPSVRDHEGPGAQWGLGSARACVGEGVR